MSEIGNKIEIAKEFILKFCDKDGKNGLEECNSQGINEISLFDKTLKTLDKDGNFIFEGNKYNAFSKSIFTIENLVNDYSEYTVQKTDALTIASIPKPEELIINIENNAKKLSSEVINLKGKKISENEKEIFANKLMKKYKKIWRSSNLGIEFYKKIFDVIPKLNLKVDKFDSKNFASVEEQIADRLLILFANEAALNSKTVNKNGEYGGLFQLSNVAVKGMKRWAKDNPNSFINKINTNFNDYSTFAKNITAEQQLDWLIAYAGCKGCLDKDKTVDELAKVVKAARKLANVTKKLDETVSKNKIPYGTSNIT